MRTTLLVSLLGLVACSLDGQTVTWDPLEPEEVRTALREPTAELDDVLKATARATLGGRLVGVFEHSRLLADVADGLAEAAGIDGSGAADAGAGPAEADREVDYSDGAGTRVFLSLGCPGAGPVPDYNTANGVVRIDSGLLNSPDPKALLDGGSLRFTFLDCQLGALRVDGTAPVALGLDAEALGLPPDTLPTTDRSLILATDLSSLQIADSDLRVGVLAIACTGYGRCADAYVVAVELIGERTGSVVISFELERTFWQDGGTRTLALHTSNLTTECSYDFDARDLDCSVDTP